MVAQCVKLPCGTSASHVGMLIGILGFLLLIQLPCNALLEALGDDASSWILATQRGDMD